MTKYNILKIYWLTNEIPQSPLRTETFKQRVSYKEAYAFCNDDNNRFESKEYFYGFMEDKP